MKSEQIPLHKLEIPPLDILAREVVSGALTGLHKSPFHGYSAEFREHKMYSSGESIKFIDWKVYAKTNKLYIKKFDEETNMNVRFILDASSSMYFPEKKAFDLNDLNKIGFSVVATAVLMEIIRKQRDAVGLSVFHEKPEINLPEKTNTLHRKVILAELEKILTKPSVSRKTFPAENLHLIAESIRKQTFSVLFTDLWLPSADPSELIDAIKHLRYKSSELIVFHVLYKKEEELFDYDNVPTRFVDLETGQSLNIYPNELKKHYRETFGKFLNKFRESFYNYRIDYVPVDTSTPYHEIISSYLQKRLRMK